MGYICQGGPEVCFAVSLPHSTSSNHYAAVAPVAQSSATPCPNAKSTSSHQVLCSSQWVPYLLVSILAQCCMLFARIHVPDRRICDLFEVQRTLCNDDTEAYGVQKVFTGSASFRPPTIVIPSPRTEGLRNPL